MKYHYSQTDTYSKKAKKENYPARSIYKLQEIDQKYKIIEEGNRVLDLGCAPGSWLLYLSKKAGYDGKIIGVDINDLKIEIPQNVFFVKESIIKFETGEKFNVVVSDLAAHTTGIEFSDVEETLELCYKALEVAKKALLKGGNFLCKVFEGEGTDNFFKEVKKNFEFTKRFKPKASRKQSREMYIVGMGFKG
jgi:23S rRNA (uridine2552-2'-O)-methyltransferase